MCDKFEYAWPNTEPYVSQNDEYIAEHDDVDFDIVLEACQYREETIEAMADAGFNFVRICMDTRYFFTEDEYFAVDSVGQIFKGNIDVYNVRNWQELDQVIEWCIERGVHVCIDVHSTPGGYMIGGDEEESRQGLFSETDDSDAKIFLKFWEEAAERYSDINCKAISNSLLLLCLHIRLWF